MKDHPLLEFEIHDADVGKFYHHDGAPIVPLQIDAGHEKFVLCPCPGCGESILHELEFYEKMMSNTPNQSLIRLGFCGRCRSVKRQLRSIERETGRNRDTLR